MKKRIMLQTLATDVLTELLNKAQFNFVYIEEDKPKPNWFDIEPESGWVIQIDISQYPNIYHLYHVDNPNVGYRHPTPGGVIERLQEIFKDWVRIQTGPDYLTINELAKIYEYQTENRGIMIIDKDQIDEDYPCLLNLQIVEWKIPGNWSDEFSDDYPRFMRVSDSPIKVLVHVDEGTYCPVDKIERDSLIFYSKIEEPEFIWEDSHTPSNEIVWKDEH